jgi:hypothetical protein
VRKLGQQHDNGQLEHAAGESMPPARFKVAGELGELPVVLCRYEVTDFVVVIGTPRTSHGVVCCAT